MFPSVLSIKRQKITIEEKFLSSSQNHNIFAPWIFHEYF
jgi:hypothetical protein